MVLIFYLSGMAEPLAPPAVPPPAPPRACYTRFQQVLRLESSTLNDSLWDAFFPDGTGTRNPIVFRYRVSSLPFH